VIFDQLTTLTASAKSQKATLWRLFSLRGLTVMHTQYSVSLNSYQYGHDSIASIVRRFVSRSLEITFFDWQDRLTVSSIICESVTVNDSEITELWLFINCLFRHFHICSYLFVVYLFIYLLRKSLQAKLPRSKLPKVGDQQIGNWHVNCQRSSQCSRPETKGTDCQFDNVIAWFL